MKSLGANKEAVLKEKKLRQKNTRLLEQGLSEFDL